MDNISELFKKMVLNPDFYTCYTSFSFKTVFYRTPYSYCCCPCAHQLEYFDYLSDKDEIDEQKERHIDEAVFEGIVQNIADGRCPHTSGMKPKYLATSTVYTTHIQAASGSRSSINSIQISWPSLHPVSSIFQLHPYVNLVLKNCCHISELKKTLGHSAFLQACKVKIMYPLRLKDDNGIVHLERLSLLECCARKRNSKVFEHIIMSLRPHTWSCHDLSIVYDLASKYELKETIANLIENGLKIAFHQHNSQRFDKTRTLQRLIGTEAAIVYNHPRILDHVLRPLAGRINQMERDKLVFICLALQRAECRKILLKYGFSEHKKLTDLDQQDELFHILFNYSRYRKEIHSIIQGHEKIQLPMVHHNFKVSFNCLLKQPCCRRINSKECIQLMALGEEIDLTNLEIEHLDDVLRELVELCLFSNLSNLNYLAEQIVSMYIEQYYETDLDNINLIFKESHDPGEIGGEYTMDATEHFLFSGENFAMNFIIPLLIECGFPLRRNLIDIILHDEEVNKKLHPAETEYLIQSLECPRSLQLCCRDSLRRHFKNRQIHRYVSISNVPSKIKDFLLLTTVLPTLKNTCFQQDHECSKDLP